MQILHKCCFANTLRRARMARFATGIADAMHLHHE
jgi:hypothetical protein